ncbi:MAG: dihydroorotate dehydrogenase family protein [Chloroflexi bacterium OLB15]|nr:MAG: dihydroorotate dehydrogenase family protein [Chloroflexi bacterium OLB15]
MLDLTTTYMGYKLRSPLVASASPLSETVDGIKRLEDAGAGAVVMFSLFEEQLKLEQLALDHYLTYGTESYAEALSYFPEPQDFKTTSEGYLELIRKAKESVEIPIFASLNGTTPEKWVSYAQKIEEAGADGLELNLYSIPTDPEITGAEIEQHDIDVVNAVRRSISIPVAVKLSPYFSNMANMAKRFDEVGASSLVLFNRFYQPDIDVETLEVRPNLLLSTPQAQRLPMRWIAILYGRIHADLAATGGVHSGMDVVKMLLAGATVTMMASALLKHGHSYLSTIEHELLAWMTEYEYVSVAEMRGALSQQHAEDPAAYERAQYMKALTYYRAVKS